jgi:hypothetical protein
MSDFVEFIAIVEGKTEQIFIEKLLAPYLGNKRISIKATQVTKPGQKGGDVTFNRVEKDLVKHLKQRKNTYITTFIDYYGLKQWPQLEKITSYDKPKDISKKLNLAALEELNNKYAELRINERFIPFIAIHEFEALLFSDAEILSNELGIDRNKIDALLSKFGSPEAIDNSPHTAPSKVLEVLSNHKFKKTVNGIDIAQKIGIEKIREKCSLFNEWLNMIEKYKNKWVS